MVKFKIVKPFIVELLGLIFLIILTIWGFQVEKLVTITFQTNFFTIVFIIMIVGHFLFYLFHVFNLGIRALFDFTFQRAEMGNYEFVQELPYKASVFCAKLGPSRKKSLGMYYLIKVKRNDKIIDLISPSFLELQVGKIYNITFASSSHVILDLVDKYIC